MSTTSITTWAVDMKDVGAIYPFEGFEVLMVIVAVAAWIAWHIWCNRWEQNYHREKIRKYGDAENLKKVLNGD